ncbi:DUF5462 family protein [Cronobacter universalis]|uniref:DUF5462 family protein n=1 Tax=Cronobacter universalis TaxID=535744 RepID=UPI003CF76229
MKIALMVVAFITSLPVLATGYVEKTQYLGVVNGQVVGNSVVKVIRTPADPVLYRSDDIALPEQLLVRNAEVRPASGGMAYIRAKQSLSENREARLTLKTTLMVDGHKTVLNATQQGEDVLIKIPEATKRVELRTDAPAELEIPANYRGNLEISVEVES